MHSDPTSLFGSAQGTAKGCLSLPPCSSKVVDAVWGLARLSTQLQDGAMAALAGESDLQAPCLTGQQSAQQIAVYNRASLRDCMTVHAMRACCTMTSPNEWSLTSIVFLAGELLALLGPLSPSAVSFNTHLLVRPVTVDSAEGTPSAESDKPSSRKSGQHTAAAVAPWLVGVLRQLHAALLDADVTVIKVAQVTLR